MKSFRLWYILPEWAKPIPKHRRNVYSDYSYYNGKKKRAQQKIFGERNYIYYGRF